MSIMTSSVESVPQRVRKVEDRSSILKVTYIRWINYKREIMSLSVNVQTQIRENYGAHEWDGKGDCPQMWKNKGGNDFLLKGAPSIEDALDFVYSYIVGDPDEYFNETIIGGTETVGDGGYDSMIIEWDKRFERFPTNVLMKGCFEDA
tara:strand:+ start:841 stop:1284 length:444 start_codon:yes stop_codon:yes gene_type:complete